MAAINLADLYRQLGRDGDGEIVLRAALAASPREAALHHALGLALTRLKQSGEALAELHKATELQPDNQRYAYVYAVALHSAGRRDEAVAALKQALQGHPTDRDVLSALIAYYREAGNAKVALIYAERLATITPEDHNLQNFIQELRRSSIP
jgi:Flp pilus assembly protein TadD